MSSRGEKGGHYDFWRCPVEPEEHTLVDGGLACFNHHSVSVGCKHKQYREIIDKSWLMA